MVRDRIRRAIQRRVRALFNDAARGEAPVVRRPDGLFGPRSVAWRVHGDVTAMMVGGGTPLLGPTARWAGVGHNGFISDGGKDYVVYHGYDLEKNGAQTLRISPVTWTKDGWPLISH